MFQMRSLVVGVLMTLVLSTPSFAGTLTPLLKSTLDSIYEGYDNKNQCWRYHADEPGDFYCFKVDRIDNLTTDKEKRIYVMLAASKYDENGESGAHVDSGRVGAFVLKPVGNKLTVLAGDNNIDAGAFGQAPTKWKWVKLGPDNYWGWLNSWSDAHQGIAGSQYMILAPYGKGIKDLSNITESFTDEGNCDPDAKCKATTYESTLKIDTTQIQEKVFPIILTASGKIKGKPIKSKSWTVPFNTTTWSYDEPKDWPMKDVDY